MSRQTPGNTKNITQLYGSDLRVRIRPVKADELGLALYFWHAEPGVLADAREVHPDAANAGMVEFQGAYGNTVVTLGWDWVQLETGQVVPLVQGGPRTNLQLLDPQGYDIPGPAHEEALWQLVANLPWGFEPEKNASGQYIQASSGH